MAKEDFCFTYYDGDAARDKVALKKRVQRGAYDDIVGAQRSFGHLTLDFIKALLDEDFASCWPLLSMILKTDGDGKYYIEWLRRSVEDMKAHSKKQSENGKNGGRPKNEKPNETQTKANHNPTDKPDNNQKKPLEDKDVNEDEDVNGNKEGGAGEGYQKLIIPQMWEVWRQSFPNYTADKERDFQALGSIYKFMMGQVDGHMNDPGDTNSQIMVLNSLQAIADVVKKEEFWSSKPLKSIASNIQEFANKIKNGSAKTGNNKTRREQLNKKFAERYGSGSANGGK